jgi:thiosulfate dehydrogenase
MCLPVIPILGIIAIFSMKFWKILIVLFVLAAAGTFVLHYAGSSKNAAATPSMEAQAEPEDSLWVAPDISNLPYDEESQLIRYGLDLIAHTSVYFGPRGEISKEANGMNCQNCHMEAGTKPFANNFGAVYSKYPTHRPRRNAVESIPQRVNDCFERSLNGKGIDSTSQEMLAMIAYFKWLGSNVPKGKIPPGTGIREPELLNRPADPAKGEMIYLAKCKRCHGDNGEGALKPDGIEYSYPPLWGPHSYNTGAGLLRLSRIAGYVKDNMPFDAKMPEDRLSNEEAWDVAAFVVSRPRPVRSFSNDWPKLSLKPFDHPFGPYTDSFPERQHKYGPFAPIKKAREEADKKKSS